MSSQNVLEQIRLDNLRCEEIIRLVEPIKALIDNLFDQTDRLNDERPIFNPNLWVRGTDRVLFVQNYERNVAQWEMRYAQLRQRLEVQLLRRETLLGELILIRARQQHFL